MRRMQGEGRGGYMIISIILAAVAGVYIGRKSMHEEMMDLLARFAKDDMSIRDFLELEDGIHEQF